MFLDHITTYALDSLRALRSKVVLRTTRVARALRRLLTVARNVALVATVVALRAGVRQRTRRRRAVTRQVTEAATVVARAAITARRTAVAGARTRNVARHAAAVALAPGGGGRGLRAVTRHMAGLVAAEARLWHGLVRARRRYVTLLATVVAVVNRCAHLPSGVASVRAGSDRMTSCTVRSAYVRRPQLQNSIKEKTSCITPSPNTWLRNSNQHPLVTASRKRHRFVKKKGWGGVDAHGAQVSRAIYTLCDWPVGMEVCMLH